MTALLETFLPNPRTSHRFRLLANMDGDFPSRAGWVRR
jgi:hypothetical protein